MKEEEEQGDDRPPVYVEYQPAADLDLVVYRASALGQCSSSLLEFRYGDNIPSPHPQWLLDRFTAGKRNESVILQKFYDPKWGRPWKSMGGGQLEVELPVGEGIVVRGHLDDVCQRVPAINDTVTSPVGEKRVVEAKKFGPSYMKDWNERGLSAFPLYEFQLSIYMWATGMPAVFVVGESQPDPDHPDDRSMDKVEKIHVLMVDEPPVSMGAIKLKVAKIEAMYQQGKRFEKCDREMYPCQWYYLLHDVEPAADVKVVEDVELDVAASLYRRGLDLEAEGKRLKDESRAVLMQKVGSMDGQKCRTIGYEVEIVNRVGKQKLNENKVLEFHGPHRIEDFMDPAGVSSYPKVTKIEVRGEQ